jgi:hypothetical protein
MSQNYFHVFYAVILQCKICILDCNTLDVPLQKREGEQDVNDFVKAVRNTLEH